MNLGVIGCNTMGLMHCQMAENAGLKVVACGDISRDNARKAARKFGAEAVGDCVALCNRDDVDVVAVCTPTPTHTEYIQAAAGAGDLAAAQADDHVFPMGRALQVLARIRI